MRHWPRLVGLLIVLAAAFFPREPLLSRARHHAALSCSRPPGLFSGPTRYISLATVAFFGIGAYTVAVLNEKLPYPAILVVAALVGLVVALIVGLSTLRLSGIYFVIFTFGLSGRSRQIPHLARSTSTARSALFSPTSRA